VSDALAELTARVLPDVRMAYDRLSAARDTLNRAVDAPDARLHWRDVEHLRTALAGTMAILRCGFGTAAMEDDAVETPPCERCGGTGTDGQGE